MIFTHFPQWLITLVATFIFQGNRIVAHPYINRSALFVQVPVASLLRRPVNKAHSVSLVATPNMGSFLTRPVRSIKQLIVGDRCSSPTLIWQPCVSRIAGTLRSKLALAYTPTINRLNAKKPSSLGSQRVCGTFPLKG